MNQRTDMMATAVATIALVVAIAAAAMAWVAFDHTNNMKTESTGSSDIDQSGPASIEKHDDTVLPGDNGNTNSTTVPQSQP